MLCDICKKNSATVHLTEIINDQTKELHLCEECAHQKSQHIEQQFGLSDLLAGFTHPTKPIQDEEAVLIKCSNCGLTFKDFSKIGRLGCGECYSAFKKYLGPLLKKIHGSSLHHGKTPYKLAKALKKKIDLQSLRSQLQKAVEAEAYEEAARLRDQIRELEERQSQESDKKANK